MTNIGRNVVDCASTENHTRGMPAIAVTASMLLPGLGHFVVGDRRAAAKWFTIFAFLFVAALFCMGIPILVPAILLLLPVGLALQICLWVSAFRTAKISDRRLFRSTASRYLLAIALALIAIFIAPARFLVYPYRRYVVEAFVSPTASMSPTIQPMDRFLIHKLIAVKRFDIVAVRPADPRNPNEIYAKRVVGFPGETIEIRNGGVSVNGNVLQPAGGAGPYSSTDPTARQIQRPDGRFGNGIHGNPIKLGPDEYFFLGDNSPISSDSRYWDWSIEGHQPGTLPRSHIIGVATWIYWPPARMKSLR